MELNSPRLTYRMLTESDRELLFELDQDPEVMRFVTGGKVTTPELMDELIIPRLNSYLNRKKGWGLWGVFLKEVDKFIGWILVRPMDFFDEKRNDQDIELGWRFARASWEHGYATEAAKRVAQEIFRRNSNHTFSALAEPANKASIAIMKKLGMSYLKQDIYRAPLGDIDVVFYSVDAQKLNR